MTDRRVFLDANVIIEAFRLSVWTTLGERLHLETVETCEREALTGDTTAYGRVVVDAALLRDGLRASHPVTRAERNALTSCHRACLDMDPGERDLFAHLFRAHHPLPALIVLSSADKGVIVRAKDLDWLDRLVSLEELLQDCGMPASRWSALSPQFSAEFLSRKRTQVRLGIIP